MKIFLFYQDRVYHFILPKEVDGSYSFEMDDSDLSGLINIEARNGMWIIYSIGGSLLYYDNALVSSAELKDDTFYIVGKGNKKYLLYARDILLDKFTTYVYDNLSLIIGNTDNCNVRYNCLYLSQNEIRIYKQGNNYILEQIQSGFLYVNDQIVVSNKYILKNGDIINIFGFKIIFLNNKVLINNPGNNVVVGDLSGLTLYLFENEKPNRNIHIEEKSLYEKKDYFSKSPRIRRIIETKDITLTPPPHNSDDDIPMIMTIMPMIIMSLTSCVMIINVFTKLGSGETTLKQSWPQLATTGVMLVSMLVWPVIMGIYNKKRKARKKLELIQKYDYYLAKKEKEVQDEVRLQKDILIENLITVSDCINIINKRNVGFWDKRIDQNDFLVVRFGMGRQPLDIKIQYQEEDFSIDEDELRERADNMVNRYKYINNVPVSYSFYENKITAIMGFDKKKSFAFLNNILLQLFTFYSYEDLKVVVFTNESNKKKWNYIKYMNHNFNNEKTFRFFSSNQDSAKAVMGYLSNVLSAMENSQDDDIPDKPYYLIIIDDYDSVKRFDFIKDLTELKDEDNKGFSMIIIEEKLNKLPSKCSNFISLTNNSGAILKNSYEKQEQILFKDEIVYGIDMMQLAKMMSNIPIEFEEGIGKIPDSINFLEMYGVGKVEQLNILNRWNTNDSTVSLKSEIGVDNQEELMYLDLHEKYHGPHGLIAGTTGSGKSEFIISYILSMCINYSPDDIAFILIDYKGGGLALAFENKNIGVSLPHLAGTITNLDKAEMDRTLVSIDSEVKRRQQMFNDARDKLGESTIDIYKYQRFYKEGRIDEPIPHLFIICDEFAELKAQQPDFMDNLISVARIGRSLGVHLILATQKPSGVVNEQIWSNTRFRVCLKVQDESDSKEMLKKPDAAHIRQAGRYYLQVGYDEVYSLGQSGYSGAKYYPSDKVDKQVDKSINFINDFGQPIKSIQASSGNKGPAQGEQLQAVMKLIIDAANKVEKKARRLWLDNIPETILVDDLEKKYNITFNNFLPMCVVGEYDAPEKQEQGKVIFDLLEDGNTAIYGNDGSEREMLLNVMIYNLSKNYTSEQINIYTIDYGSESLRRYQSLPHVGGMVFAGEDEKYNNLLKMLKEEVIYRKKVFVDYGGEYKNFIKNSSEKLPLMLVIVNNYDSIYEANQSTFEVFPDIVRDSERYGIIYIFTADGINSIGRKLSQNLPNSYAFKLKDQYDYTALFGVKTKMSPRDLFGRGLINNDGIHEFQTAKIVEDDNMLNEFLQKYVIKQKEINKSKAKKIPILPDIVRYNDIQSGIKDYKNIPVGIIKDDLELSYLNLESSLVSLISSNKIINMNNFSKSLLYLLKSFKDTNLLVIDPKKKLDLEVNEFKNYYTENLNEVTNQIIKYIEGVTNDSQAIIIFIYNLSKYFNVLEDSKKFTNLLIKMKSKENIKFIFADDYLKLKAYQYEEWFKVAINTNEGIWIGKGFSEQNLFKITSFSREMTKNINNDMGYVLNESTPYLCKLIDFISEDELDNK